MIKTILFDVDGTLLDTKSLIIETIKKVFTFHFSDVRLTEDEITKIFFGPPLNVSFKAYVKSEDELNMAISTYRKYNLELHDEFVVAFSGAKETLSYLKKRGIKLGVVSSKMHDVVKRGLELTGLLKYIDCVIGLDDCDEHKPSPKPILEAINALSSKPNQTLYVGDHPNDIEAGRKAGVYTCAVTYSEFLSDLLALFPTYVIDELINLKDIV